MKTIFMSVASVVVAVGSSLLLILYITESRRSAAAELKVEIAQYGKRYLTIDGVSNICQEWTLKHDGKGFKISFQQKVVGEKGGDGRVYVKGGSSDKECHKTLEAAIYYDKY